MRYALLILANVPFAVIGGVALLFFTHTNLSVSTSIGFIALAGVSVQMGMVLVGMFNQLRVKGMPLHEAVVEGSKARLRPVLMTALMAAIGMYPAAVCTGIGSEVQRPLALVHPRRHAHRRPPHPPRAPHALRAMGIPLPRPR